MRHAPALLVLAAVVAACHRAPTAEESAQARYRGRALAEWWVLRRDPDMGVEQQASEAMRMLGPRAVPFLADKAASHDLGEMIGGSSALVRMCTDAVPAMEAARSSYPSAALDDAIRRVRASAPDNVRLGLCTPAGEPRRAGQPGE